MTSQYFFFVSIRPHYLLNIQTSIVTFVCHRKEKEHELWLVRKVYFLIIIISKERQFTNKHTYKKKPKKNNKAFRLKLKTLISHSCGPSSIVIPIIGSGWMWTGMLFLFSFCNTSFARLNTFSLGTPTSFARDVIIRSHDYSFADVCGATDDERKNKTIKL